MMPLFCEQSLHECLGKSIHISWIHAWREPFISCEFNFGENNSCLMSSCFWRSIYISYDCLGKIKQISYQYLRKTISNEYLGKNIHNSYEYLEEKTLISYEYFGGDHLYLIYNSWRKPSTSYTNSWWKASIIHVNIWWKPPISHMNVMGKVISSHTRIWRHVQPALVAQSDAHLTGDQEVVGSMPSRSGNIISWILILKSSRKHTYIILTPLNPTFI